MVARLEPGLPLGEAKELLRERAAGAPASAPLASAEAEIVEGGETLLRRQDRRLDGEFLERRRLCDVDHGAQRRGSAGQHLALQAPERLERHEGSGLVCTYITRADMARHGVSEDEIEGLSNFLNLVVDAETMIVLREAADDPKVRFCAVQGERVRLGDADNATLACLVTARPPEGAEQERVLDEWAMERAVAAWELASERVVEDWNWRADPANVRPRTPRAMELAIEIVQRGPLPAGMGREAADELVERLRAPYAERYLRRFRAIINDDALTDPEKVKGFAELADELRADVR